MRGGIQKKGKNYYAVIYDGIDPGTGRKIRRWVPAGTRRADAEKVLADVIRRKYDGEPVPTEFAQYGCTKRAATSRVIGTSSSSSVSRGTCPSTTSRPVLLRS
ncbi:MAG: hypothetical protein ACRD07_18340 [Acidimicrobiales bacterium]